MSSQPGSDTADIEQPPHIIDNQSDAHDTESSLTDETAHHSRWATTDTAVEDHTRNPSDVETAQPAQSKRQRKCCPRSTRFKCILLGAIVSIIFLLCLTSVVVYLYVHFQLQQAVNSEASLPNMELHDIGNQSINASMWQDNYVEVPFPLTMLPDTMTYSVNEVDTLRLPLPGYTILPTENRLKWASTERVEIINPDALQKFGNDILKALTNGSQAYYEFRMRARGPVRLRVYNFFAFNFDFDQTTKFTLGGPETPKPATNAQDQTGSSEDNESGVKIGALGLSDGRIKFNLAFNNTSPISADLGDIDAIVERKDKTVTTLNVDDFVFKKGSNEVSLTLQVQSFWRVVTTAISTLFRNEEGSTLTIRNITLSKNGQNVTWLNGWFEDVSVSLPLVS